MNDHQINMFLFINKKNRKFLIYLSKVQTSEETVNHAYSPFKYECRHNKIQRLALKTIFNTYFAWLNANYKIHSTDFAWLNANYKIYSSDFAWLNANYKIYCTYFAWLNARSKIHCLDFAWLNFNYKIHFTDFAWLNANWKMHSTDFNISNNINFVLSI